MSSEDTVVHRLAVTPEQLIGYAYAGLLAALIAAILQTALVKTLVDALGGVLASLAAVGIGVGIYVLYFKVVGEFLLYPLQHLFHRCLDWTRGKTTSTYTSAVGYLGGLGVRFGHRRAAYEAIKAFYFDEDQRRRIQLAHGELHVLYITAVQTLVAAALEASQHHSYSTWLWVSGVAYLAGLLADTRQHAIEASLLRARPRAELTQFLSAGGYLSLTPKEGLA